jgi:two-component system, cell cycle sensor histidine kinase and response regulator CckA
LLAFSRRQVLQPRILDLNDSIDEIRSMLVRLIGEDIELRVELGTNLGLVRADPGQLTQVLMNLAVNARDAMPNGGTLALQTEGVVLDDAFALAHDGVRPGPHVMLTVSDTGAGMDGKTLGHLYEPFFTTKDPGKGTGLGLATVYGIVRQSEGSIDVRSEVGRGSSFRICLPQVQVDDAMVDVEWAGSGSDGGHETVLVVEDEESVRRLAISVLERQGYAVLSAEGPMSAEAILVEHAGTIDLLLTDVIMPGGNGADLAVRATALRPNLRVLMMSGYAQDALLERSPADLAASLIEKPFTPDILLARVRVALDARSAGAAGR